MNHIFCDSPLGNRDSELEQLAVNARSAPQRVGVAHRPDQGNGLWVDSLATSSARSAFPLPEETESFAMPSDHGVGLDDQKVGLPGMPVLGEPGPQSTVQWHQARPFTGPAQDKELMAQRQVLQQQISAGFQCRGEEAEQQSQPMEHAVESLAKTLTKAVFSGRMELLPTTGIRRQPSHPSTLEDSL